MLACSFCGKSEDEVAKLVAGPNVYICDKCVAIADAIMRADGDPREGMLKRLWRRFRNLLIPSLRKRGGRDTNKMVRSHL